MMHGWDQIKIRLRVHIQWVWQIMLQKNIFPKFLWTGINNNKKVEYLWNNHNQVFINCRIFLHVHHNYLMINPNMLQITNSILRQLLITNNTSPFAVHKSWNGRNFNHKFKMEYLLRNPPEASFHNGSWVCVSAKYVWYRKPFHNCSKDKQKDALSAP